MIGPQGLPLTKPPYGRITAIDLNTGDHIWMVANGETPDCITDHPALAGVDIPVFCYHPKMKPVGACRMCFVEIEKMPRLQTACTMPVADTQPMGITVEASHTRCVPWSPSASAGKGSENAMNGLQAFGSR